MSIGSEPAYPVKRDKEDTRIPDDFMFAGLTKRELLAAMAMQGLSANAHESLVACDYEKIATHAVKQTDALLAELAKAQP